VKTPDLIRLLSQDAQPSGRYDRSLWMAMLAGMALAALLFMAEIGMRPDIMAAAGTVRFLAKMAIVAVLGIAALGLVFRIGRPGVATGPWRLALLAAPALLVIGLALELLITPAGDWATRLVGRNWLFCLTYIPMLALGPLACLLVALRAGAPENPTLAGAAAGLAASGIAAFLYGTHCTDDSPLFVATWYTIATLLVTGVGAFAGSRLLRW
jgi:hypothetical protein